MNTLKAIFLVVFFSVCLPTGVYGAGLEQLHQAKKELVDGKAQIIQGQKDVRDAYYTVKNDVVIATDNAVKSLQPQKDTLRNAYSTCRTVDESLNALTYTVILSAPAKQAKDLFGNTSDIVNGIISTVTSIEQTLINVRDTVDPYVEKINPNTFLYTLAALQQTYNWVTAQLETSMYEFTQSYNDLIIGLLTTTDTTLQTAKKNLNFLTQECTNPGLVKPLLNTLHTTLQNINKDQVSQDAPTNPKPDNMDSDEGRTYNRRKDLARTLLNRLSSAAQALNSYVPTPDVYIKLKQAELDLDKAIMQIDSIINDFGALIEAL